METNRPLPLEPTQSPETRLYEEACEHARLFMFAADDGPLTNFVLISRYGEYCARNGGGDINGLRRYAAAGVLHEHLFPET